MNLLLRSLSNDPANSDCLIIKKSGEIGLSETLATIRQLTKTVPIPGRKRNYNLNKTNETTFKSVFPEFHALFENLLLQLRNKNRMPLKLLDDWGFVFQY